MKLIFVGMLCFILSACVSGVADKSTDWSKLGERVAMRGDVLVNELAFNEQYAGADLTTASFLLFQTGFAKGLESFCKIDNAFKHGIKGGSYNGQCDHFPRGVEFKYEWNKAFKQFMFPEGPK
ncbi:DUF2799 domain-containing protein [Psychromonas hadalis]|uniref:DUF2799 domain-containing protein n=1 Tax=Psychromonas hadalis TaxID=211669 RepID=UPI0003B433BA|nr:DUF2799 domain-containing protein [Psychromonas hadalis]